MVTPTRQTRRRIAYWMMLPGDTGPIEQALAMVTVPSLVAGVVSFITEETAGDHSERKHGTDSTRLPR